MALQSDLSLNRSKMDHKAITEKTHKLNEFLIKGYADIPKWWEVGVAEFRHMKKTGSTVFPAPIRLPQHQDFSIPSRDTGRTIPCRYAVPKNGKSAGVLVYFHGGGWVLGDQESYDPWLEFFAEKMGLTAISIGYRKAPEDPYPAAPNDSFDAVEWLVQNSTVQFGVELKVICGESAGAHLAVLSIIHLRRTRPAFHFAAAILTYGVYDLSMSPSVRLFTEPLILNAEILEHSYEAFLPGLSEEARRDPAISPLYADLKDLDLPPAILLVGTEDALVDDTLFMSVRWMACGGEAVVKLYPGASHGFIMFPSEVSDMADAAQREMVIFVVEKMR